MHYHYVHVYLYPTMLYLHTQCQQTDSKCTAVKHAPLANTPCWVHHDVHTLYLTLCQCIFSLSLLTRESSFRFLDAGSALKASVPPKPRFYTNTQTDLLSLRPYTLARGPNVLSHLPHRQHVNGHLRQFPLADAPTSAGKAT